MLRFLHEIAHPWSSWLIGTQRSMCSKGGVGKSNRRGQPLAKSFRKYGVYLLLFNEADLATSLDAGNFDLRQIVGFRLQPHILLEVMF